MPGRLVLLESHGEAKVPTLASQWLHSVSPILHYIAVSWRGPYLKPSLAPEVDPEDVRIGVRICSVPWSYFLGHGVRHATSRSGELFEEALPTRTCCAAGPGERKYRWTCIFIEAVQMACRRRPLIRKLT